MAGVIEGQESIGADAPRGPVPPENRPGHHPEQEQDKPDLDAFAQRLGIGDAAEDREPEPAVATEPVAAVAGVARSGAGRIAALVAVVLAVLGIVLTKQRRRKRS